MKKSRTFNKDAPLTAAPVAAAYMGIPATTLLHCANGTLCLNEFVIKIGNRVFYYTAQVMLHTANMMLHGACDGDCRIAAVRAREAARQVITEISRDSAPEKRIM